jgi:putative ABC transport system substrate-binding protein
MKHEKNTRGQGNPIKRRDLMALLGGAMVAWPTRARTATALPHIAFLAVGFGADTTAFDAIRDDLRGLGEDEGKAYVADVHGADDLALVPQLAEKIVAADPALIVTINATAVPELLKFTQTIPIVVAFVADPLALGFSQSIARPTRNVTGMLNLQDVLLVKRIELLGQIAGPMKRVGLVYQKGTPASALVLSVVKGRTGAKGPELVLLGLSSESEIATVLDRSEARTLDGLVVVGSPMIVTDRDTLIAAEIARRLAAMHDFAFEVHDGALASYGTNPSEYFERAAEYAARLLHGAKVSDLPFEAPRNFHLALNQRTARAIGLTIPPTMLALADDVIE